MTIPEWVIIVVLGAIGAVFWWGVLRLINTQDIMSVNLSEINKNLGIMNGRLGKSEVWQTSHEKTDDGRHIEAKEHFVSLWQAISDRKHDKL